MAAAQSIAIHHQAFLHRSPPSMYALHPAPSRLFLPSCPAFSSLRLHSARRRLSVSAASFQDSGPIDSEEKGIKVEEILKKHVEDSNESSEQAADNLKDEDIKVGGAWKDSTGESAQKYVGVLRDTTEQLKEQAEKARVAVAATAQETAERSKENLTYIAENAPDPIKDIAETALRSHSFDNKKKGAKIHDFCLGIPYGACLVVGGLLWFIITGSTDAFRFGVILGGVILSLSVQSLNAWKEGKSSTQYIKGQIAITLFILLREIKTFFEVKAIFPCGFVAVASAGMLGFYSYVYLSGGNPPKKTKHAS